MLAWFIVLLLVQAAGLAMVSGVLTSIRTQYRSKWFHPIAWVAVFYGGWFGIPQVYFLASDGFLVGLEQYDQQTRLQFAVQSQIALIVFLSITMMVALLVQSLGTTTQDRTVELEMDRALSTSDQLYALICLIVGTGAVIYLGQQNLSSDMMRSELVKTTSGKVLTSLMYFGAYGFAFMLGESLRRKRYFVAAAVLVFFGAPVMMTGARGRFLLPLMSAVVYLSTDRRRLFTPTNVSAAILCIAVIAFADRLLNSVKFDQDVDLGRGAAEVFERRNFDGFSNFTLIQNTYEGESKPSVLVRGSRDTFMNYYFAEEYSRGVGFGSTVPGTAWIAGRWWGLAIVAVGYGIVLGLLDQWLRRMRDPQSYWCYLISITWFASLAGNYVESIDKLAIVMMPALLAIPLRMLSQRFIQERPELR
ncbi:hypothetical protein [Rubripirellula amarantea]|nr:hypothetical protein [Rubripirellula amarantea]